MDVFVGTIKIRTLEILLNFTITQKCFCTCSFREKLIAYNFPSQVLSSSPEYKHYALVPRKKIKIINILFTN